jgi:hypothetical protein
MVVKSTGKSHASKGIIMIFLMEFNSIVNGKEEPVTGEMD